MKGIKINKIGLLYVILCVLTYFNVSCAYTDEKTESDLTCFKFVDNKIDSITTDFINHYQQLNRKYILTISLNEIDEENDTLDIVYCIYRDENRDYIRYRNIGARYYRVIGYVDNYDIEIILFTNICDYNQLTYRLSKLISPQNKTKRFDYIYHYPITYDFWPGGFLLDESRCHYKYCNGVLSKPRMDW